MPLKRRCVVVQVSGLGMPGSEGGLCGVSASAREEKLLRAAIGEIRGAVTTGIMLAVMQMPQHFLQASSLLEWPVGSLAWPGQPVWPAWTFPP